LADNARTSQLGHIESRRDRPATERERLVDVSAQPEDIEPALSDHFAYQH